MAKMDSLPMLLLGCLAGLSLPMLWQRRRPRQNRRLPAGEARDELSQLGVGAVVQHEGRDFTVTRSRLLASAGPWQQLIGLQGDAGQALLLVGAVGVEERCWLLRESERLGKVPDSAETLAATYVPPEFVQDGGLRYRLSARYLATVSIEHGSSEAVRLSCYKGPGAQRLLLLKTAGPARGQLFVGQVVSVDSLLLLPTASSGAKGAGG